MPVPNAIPKGPKSRDIATSRVSSEVMGISTPWSRGLATVKIMYTSPATNPMIPQILIRDTLGFGTPGELRRFPQPCRGSGSFEVVKPALAG